MANEKLKIIRLFSYFGTKGQLVHQNAYPVPRHHTIIEPFAGSAAYSCRYGLDRNVLLFELDMIVFGVLDYLIKAKPQEILRLPLCQDGLPIATHTKLCQEQQWLIGFWGRVGSVIPAKKCYSWRNQRKGGDFYNYPWNTRTRERLAATVSLIKHWKVFNSSYECAPNRSATWFVDPPYQHGVDIYRQKAAVLDFKQLGQWCKARRGQLIVCETAGATWLPFKVIDSTATHIGAWIHMYKPSHKRVELIYER